MKVKLATSTNQRRYSNFHIATILPHICQSTHDEMPSPSASPIGSSSSSVSSSPSSPDLGHERSQPGQATHPIQHRTGDVHEILKRYFYDLHVQKYLGQLEMARLQPPEWTQKQQQQFATLESSSSGAGGEGMGPERKRYSERQTKMLRGAYRRSKYISRQDMVWLAEECGLTSMQVKIWFQNRRLKDRKMCRERGEKFPDPPAVVLSSLFDNGVIKDKNEDTVVT